MSAVDWRRAFADFLARLATDSDREGEWFQLVVTHYPDEELEAIRRELARLSIKRNPMGGVSAWQPEDRKQMVGWAEQLSRPSAP